MAEGADGRDLLHQATGRWVLLVTVLGSGLVIIDVTAMNVIAPGIQADLGTSVAAVQWVIEAYTLFLASVMLVGGALADRYGRRKVFGIGATGFALASLACGLAPDAPTLIVARALQGLAGSLMVPGSLALIGAHFERAQRGHAIGIWSGMSGLTAVLGPVLGGVLSDIGSWRWIFYLNVPIALGLLIPLVLYVPESRRPRTNDRLDIPGAILATGGLGALTYGIIQAGIEGWADATTLTGLALGLIGLLAFVQRERTTAAPMLPLGLFRNRNFAGANILTLFVYFALAAGMFFVPMRLIFLDGYSPSAAGFAMVPVILLISLLSPRFGALTDRFGARMLLTLGPATAAAGFLVLAAQGANATYWTGHVWGLSLVGLGMAMVIAPLTTTVLGSVPDDDVGVASGVNNAVSRLGALLAIAISGLVALAVFTHWLGAGLAVSDLTPAEQDAAWALRHDLAAADPPPALDEQAARTTEALYDTSFLAAYRAVQATMGISALIGAVAGWLWIRPDNDNASSTAGIPT